MIFLLQNVASETTIQLQQKLPPYDRLAIGVCCALRFTQYLTFTNLEPGRASQALQAFPIDGREVRQIQVSLDVRGANIQPGRSSNDLPMFVIVFYDERRAILKTLGIGPWRGTLDWRHETEKFDVPVRAREAIVRIGLFGGTGEFSLDNLVLKVTERK